jgi:hypothetical protein
LNKLGLLPPPQSASKTRVNALTLGEGWGGGVRDGRGNYFQDAQPVGHHVVVIEPKDAKAFVHKERISPGISPCVFVFEVLPAIDFNDELCIVTDEINNVWAYRGLTTKARAAHAMGAQCGPDAPLGIGRIAPQCSRAVALFGRHVPVR